MPRLPATTIRSAGVIRAGMAKPDRVKKRLKARFAQVPEDRALVDELIAERREQFCLEDSRPESV